MSENLPTQPPADADNRPTLPLQQTPPTAPIDHSAPRAQQPTAPLGYPAPNLQQPAQPAYAPQVVPPTYLQAPHAYGPTSPSSSYAEFAGYGYPAPQPHTVQPGAAPYATATAPKRRRTVGWIVAAAAAGVVLAAAGIGSGITTVTALTHTANASSGSSQSGGQTGGVPGGSSGTSGGSGFGYRHGYGRSGSGGGFSSGSDGTSTGGTAATSAQEVGVVIIDTVLKYDQAEAAGTGIVLTSNGEILTNNHVIEGSTSIQVTVPSTGKAYTATVVGDDPTDDIAVLQLSGASSLKTADLSSTAASTGDSVTGVGNAGGTGTLTAVTGTVTATDQSITTEAEGDVASENLTGLIQTDADIQAGDSGGPLLNGSGDVVGIDTAASEGSSQTQGYSIPIAKAESIAKQILSGDSSSTVDIGYPAFLGVEVAADGSSGSSSGDGSGSSGNGYGFGSGGGFGGGTSGGGSSSAQGSAYTQTVSGAEVEEVIDGTPAASAGLEAGDVITGVSSTTVDSSDALTTALAQYKPGDTVTITWTDTSGNTQSAQVTLTTGPAA